MVLPAPSAIFAFSSAIDLSTSTAFMRSSVILRFVFLSLSVANAIGTIVFLVVSIAFDDSGKSSDALRTKYPLKKDTGQRKKTPGGKHSPSLQVDREVL